MLDTTDNKSKIAEKTLTEKIIFKIITLLKSIKNKLIKKQNNSTPHNDEYLRYLESFKYENKKE